MNNINQITTRLCQFHFMNNRRLILTGFLLVAAYLLVLPVSTILRLVSVGRMEHGGRVMITTHYLVFWSITSASPYVRK